MKINTLQQFKTTVVAGLATSVLWVTTPFASATDEVEEIFIEDHSFENNHLDNDGNPNDNASELGSLSNAWTPYGTGNGAAVGTLFPHHSEGSTLYDADEPTPDGNRVLILFNSDVSGGAPFGVEQELTIIEGGCRYVLTVDVGNIASSNLNFEGFPIYRIQLFAGEMEIPLVQDFASLEIEEGEFETSTLSIEFGSFSEYIGEPLRLRLQNENNNLEIDGVKNNNNEVNFDNVRLQVFPIEVEQNVADQGPEKIDTNSAVTALNSDHRIDFTIPEAEDETENNSQRLLFIGRNLTLDSTVDVSELVSDPEIVLVDRVTGEELEFSDNWQGEELDSLIDHYHNQLGVEHFPTDAAIFTILPPGEYSIRLGNTGDMDAYASLKMYDLSPDNPGAIIYSTEAETGLGKPLNPNPKIDVKKFKTEESALKTPIRTKRALTIPSVLRN